MAQEVLSFRLLDLQESIGTVLKCMGVLDLRWKEPMNGNGWLRHLMAIFNQEKVKIVVMSEEEYIFNVVKGVTISGLEVNTLQKESTVEFLRRFKTVENAVVRYLPLKDSSGDAILLTNYQSLRFWNVSLNLDNMSTINSVYFDSYVDITAKDLNRFLKLWLSGSNPRLRRCDFSLPPYAMRKKKAERTLEDAVVMRGIQYHRIPEDTEREFGVNGVTETIRGGLDFMKKDGTKATVNIVNFDELVESTFQLFVWL